MANNAMYRVPDSILNALSGPQGPMGMSPNVNRLSLLPRYSKQEGLVAPQWLYDLARAAEAPGNALMGHQTTPEEAVNFGLNFAGAGLGTSAAMRNPAPGAGKAVGMALKIPPSLEESGDRTLMYHGSQKPIDKLNPYLHVGTVDQAEMRSLGPGQNIMPLAVKDGVYKRVRDNGDLKPTNFRSAEKSGARGVVYLNRYEGIPGEAFQKVYAENPGIDLNALSDKQFKKLFPMAQDSYVIFDPSRSVKSALAQD